MFILINLIPLTIIITNYYNNNNKGWKKTNNKPAIFSYTKPYN